VIDDLQRARSLNPALGVVIVNGETDLVTPYLASRYLVNQVPTLANAKPIRLDVIEGGHMMYFRPEGRRALKEAVAELYQVTQ
jgi:carboxypeptidase C (cathepsin A)